MKFKAATGKEKDKGKAVARRILLIGKFNRAVVWPAALPYSERELSMFLDATDLTDGEIFLRLFRTAVANEDKGYLPAYYFSIHRLLDDQEVGWCDLRIGHNSNTYFGGNIGYEIYEPYRGNYFAGKACKLLFQLARKHGLDYLRITCSPDNTASRKTCLYVGGKLEEIVYLPPDNEMYAAGERQKCIYYVHLKP